MSTSSQNPQKIKEMFGSIAAHYDRANAIMSLSLHHYWNRELTKVVIAKRFPKQYLDLCCGTGEIAFHLLKHADTPCEAFLLDFCPEMLACAREKAKKRNEQHHIHYLQADAQKIPLPSESIDSATMAYGIRNVADPLICCREVFRVLSPGGCFGVLELTRPANPVLKWGHHLYLKSVLPLVGKWIASNRQAYHYLRQSIHTFIPPTELEHVLREAGFQNIVKRSFCGGIATRLLATKC